MRIVIIYATNSGSTYFVSKLLEETLRVKHEVSVITAKNATAELMRSADMVIFGSPSWNYGKLEGYPHEAMRLLLERLKDEKFKRQRFAVFGCGDSSYTYFCGAVDHMERFIKEHGGKLVCPSLRIDGFYFSEVENTGRVVDWAKRLV